MRAIVSVRRAFLSPAYAKWLLAAFVAWFGVWAIYPWHPDDFLLEHILTVVFLGVLVWSHSRFPLSNISYTTIFLFMCLHVVGAHYTYSEVPYKEWATAAGSWAGFDDAGNRLFTSQVLAQAEKLAVAQGRELTRKNLEAVLGEQAHEVKKKGRAADAVPAVAHGAIGASGRGKSSPRPAR